MNITNMLYNVYTNEVRFTDEPGWVPVDDIDISKLSTDHKDQFNDILDTNKIDPSLIEAKGLKSTYGFIVHGKYAVGKTTVYKHNELLPKGKVHDVPLAVHTLMNVMNDL